MTASSRPHRLAFWLLATLLGALLFAASAPSPLYALYAARWQFSASVLTTIYAVYAFGALAALLVTGRTSDHVGRRRVVVVALIVQIAAMLAFVAADGVGGLFLARALQGLGTGMAAGAIAAWLLDLQPPDDPRLGGVVGGIALVAGLGAGALGSALLVQYAPDPLHLVYWLLTAVFVVALAGVVVLPDPVPRSPGWRQSLRPQIGVPASATATFTATAPALVATWAVGGLYLSLGPSLASTLLGSESRVPGGLVILALFGPAAISSAFTRGANARASVIWGSIVLILGVAVSLLALALSSGLGLYAGSLIAGIGFGPAFAGVLRILAPLAPPDRRGALLASIYIVIYLGFSVPAIVAGAATTQFGLRATTYAYGVVVMALALATTVALARTSGTAAQRRSL